MMNNETPDDPSDDFIAILGSRPERRRPPGTPQITIPMGYSTTHAARGQRLDPRQPLRASAT